MTGRFWVYVNHPNNKALVHEAVCSHCNDGRGRTEDKLEWNGEWHGPFADVERAFKDADASHKVDIRWCGHCARHLDVQAGRRSVKV